MHYFWVRSQESKFFELATITVHLLVGGYIYVTIYKATG